MSRHPDAIQLNCSDEATGATFVDGTLFTWCESNDVIALHADGSITTHAAFADSLINRTLDRISEEGAGETRMATPIEEFVILALRQKGA